MPNTKGKARHAVLPEDIIPIYEFHLLPERSPASVCGLVTGFRPASKSSGLDLQKEITIKDIHEDPNPDVTQRKPNVLTIKLFSREVKLLPPVERTGDVIYFKRVKAVNWRGERRALSAFDTSFALFLNHRLLNANLQHGHEVVDPHGKTSVVRPDTAGDVSRELQDYAVQLGQQVQDQLDISKAMASAGSRGVMAPTLPSKPAFNAFKTQQHQPYQPPMTDSFYDSRYKQIKDLDQTSYSATIVGEIVKMFDNYQYLDVYVTDYTSSPLLYNRMDSINSYNDRAFPGPTGRMTLKIELQDPHRGAARLYFQERNIVMFRNVRCKMANSGEGLEGTLWPDRKYPEKIHIVSLDASDARVVQLMQRKQQYYGDSMPSLPDNALSALKDNQEETEKSKSRRKRDKKVQKERERKEAEKLSVTAQKPTSSGAAIENGNKKQGTSARAQPSSQGAQTAAGRQTDQADVKRQSHSRPNFANRQVETSSDHQFSSYEDIVRNPRRQIVIPGPNDVGTALMEVPFVNVNHRVVLRIVDYQPKDVWSFARLIENDKWIWQLTLLTSHVDSNTGRDSLVNLLPIEIDDEAGRELFGVEARSIVQDEDEQKALAKAQKKWFALVGDELPQMKEASSNETSEETSPTDGQPKDRRWPFWNRMKAKAGPIARSAPFEACIAEYGVRCEHADAAVLSCEMCVWGWRRMYGLHSTRVVDAQPAPFRRDRQSQGTTAATAIALDSDDDPMDLS